VSATEWVLVAVVILVVLAAAFALVGGLASWAVATRAVDRHLAEVKPGRDTTVSETFTAAVDEAVLLTHEPADDDEDADHFALWEAELHERPGIAKHLRRMEKWSK
jgi:hypothetical protein